MRNVLFNSTLVSGFAGISWLSIIWVMIASVCLTLSAVHALVWLRQRSARASLMFSLLALFTSAIITFDLMMMRSTSPQSFSELLRWYHVPVWLAFVSTIGFLHAYLNAGRLWLAWCALGLRTLTLVLNFLEPVNLNFKEINALRTVSFLGDRVSVPEGVTNPLMALGQFSLLLLLVYSIDAAVTCYKRGQSRRAIAMGGAMALFIALASWQTALVYMNVIEGPVIAGIFFLGIVAVMAHELSRDILRAVQLNRDLVRERAITDAIFDGLPGMIYLYSPGGLLLRWNKRVEEESGYSHAELNNMLAQNWLDGDDVAALAREWQNAMNQRTGRFEAQLKFKDGRKVPYLLTGIRVDIDGQPHLVGMGLDISRQKKMESELQDQQRELSRLNRVASVGVLAASIAHELNQPLAAVKSNAEAGKRYLALDHPNLREVREIMNDIATANARAGDVVRGLRALMRKEPPKEERVFVNEVVVSVVLIVQAECRARKIEIEKQLAGDLPPVRGDRVQFQQVMLNLLLNAMDALGELTAPPRRISILTEYLNDDRIRLVIRDNGPGIPPEHMEDIFTPFFTSKNKGMGMGLPISRSIIELHGGTIRASRPAEGAGVAFEVEIPANET